MTGETDQGVRSRRRAASLGEIESRVGYILHRTDLLHMEAMSRRLADISLTPARATAMMFIKNNPGAGQSALATALGINRASATELVDHLEVRGLVERRPGSNRRSNALHLTALGDRLQAEFIDVTREIDRLIGTDMTDEEFALLGALLRRAGEALARRLSEVKDQERGKK